MQIVPIAPGERLLEDFVQHLEQLRVRLLVVRIRFEQPEDTLDAARDDAHRIAHQEGAARGSSNDDELGPLQQHANVAVVHRVSEQDASEDDDKSDDDEHGNLDKGNERTAFGNHVSEGSTGSIGMFPRVL